MDNESATFLVFEGVEGMTPALARTSVILPAYRSWATLPAVLEALRPQIEGREREAILVESSGQEAARELEARWPWLRVITPPDRTLPGRARNVAAGLATSSLLAFLDADAVPEPAWLDELERAMVPGIDAVAGAVINGTPRSVVGTAGYLLEFADWLPTERRPLLHGATCNLLVRRAAFEEIGGFAEDIWPGEDTVFTFGLAQSGRLAFAPAARVRHLNRTRFRDYLVHQRRLAVAFTAVCERVDFPHRSFSRPTLVPLAVPFRLAALGRRLLAHPREAATAVLLLPILVAGLAAWGAGIVGARR